VKEDNSTDFRVFPTAADDVASAKLDQQQTPQVQSASYRLAYNDTDFILREEMRPARLMLELSKTELVLNENGIQSTVVIFGSARTPEAKEAQQSVEQAQVAYDKDNSNPELKALLQQKKRALQRSFYYEQSRELAKMITEKSASRKEQTLYVVTGGGPGIMEAANRGAQEAGGKTVGLNITLPKEQAPNPFITPELCLNFHYFAMRKMHFLMRARALIVFPGGFGTLDELFDTLTLVQTQKIKPMPILLFGKGYWERLIDWQLLIEEGMIEPDDLQIFKFVETVEEAWHLLEMTI